MIVITSSVISKDKDDSQLKISKNITGVKGISMSENVCFFIYIWGQPKIQQFPFKFIGSCSPIQEKKKKKRETTLLPSDVFLKKSFSFCLFST